MESMATPLRRLEEEAAWFARDKEVRLLWVCTSASMRSTALRYLERLECHADNHSPFVVLEAPWSGRDLGAQARADVFAERFGARAQALRDAGIDIGAFAPAGLEANGLEAFALHLQRACAALRPPLRGLVVVLAPTRVDHAEAFVAQVQLLVAAQALPDVRWVVVESDTQHLAACVRQLPERLALSVDFRVDEEEQQRDLAALAGPLAEGKAAEPLPHPWGPWSSRGAMPRAAPPRRGDDGEPPSDEQLIASGIPPAYVKGGAQKLRALMLHAALALRQGRMADAIELQARTAGLCAELQLHREQVIHLLVLGGYALAASLPDRARAVYGRAAELAASHRLTMQQAQAELGLGMLAAMERQPSAARHYAAAAGLAEEGKVPALAIECWRMAGQSASDQGALDPAAECWQRALELAEALAPAEQRATSAADIARLLAELRAAQGQRAQEEQLQRRAFRMERGAEPEPAVEEA